MLKFILKRTFYMILVLFIVTTITFFLVHAIPGDPISAMVEDLPDETRDLYLSKYGYDRPVFIQYISFMKQIFTGDLGSSLRYPGRKVVDVVKTYSPVSATIGFIALAIGFFFGVVLGVVAALNRNRWSDRLIMVIAVFGTTIPTFVVAAVLQYAFSVHWKILPTSGWEGPKYIIMPVFCMCLGPLASYTRYMRSSILDITNQDYILTAEAKGLNQFHIVTRHILRNSFIPCLTMLCTSIASILSGSFIIENIFAIPGVGRYFISAINDRDYNMILGLNIIFTGIYIISILVTDILLSIIDPRIRISEGGKTA